jgi:hypothetical protein
MQHICGRAEVYTGFWWVNAKRPLGRPRQEVIKINHQEVDAGEWTGSIWLRIGTGGGHL